MRSMKLSSIWLVAFIGTLILTIVSLILGIEAAAGFAFSAIALLEYNNAFKELKGYNPVKASFLNHGNLKGYRKFCIVLFLLLFSLSLSSFIIELVNLILNNS